MGRNRIFVPQDTLDAWVVDQKAVVSGTELQMDGDVFDLEPAVFFVKDVSETSDPHSLLGRVKDKEQLATLGAEHYMGSVILGDSAYDVKDGFVGLPRARALTLPLTTPPPAGDIDAAVGAAAGEDAPSDEALLTKFLLENL